MPKMNLSDAEKEEILRWRAKKLIWNEAIEAAIKLVEEGFGEKGQKLPEVLGSLQLLKKE